MQQWLSFIREDCWEEFFDDKTATETLRHRDERRTARFSFVAFQVHVFSVSRGLRGLILIMASQIKIAVVGGGLAGLAAAMKIAEAGHAVDLFSVVPVKRSHSVCAQGGINGAVNTKGEGDSTWEHFDDTIIYLFDRMGVPFSRTKEGLLDFRRFGGTKHHRTAFAGASTGQQLLYALDEQVRRFEVAGKVQKYEGWEMMSLALDDHQVCRGLVAMNLRSLELKAFPADAVIIASGGPGLIFGKSTNSMVCTGSAVAACYQQGAKYANGEFIQVHPTSIPGDDKLRLMSESARGEGGRVWVPRAKGDKRPPSSIPEKERLYFLEEKYPAYGNLVPRDIATREIFQVCLDGLGVNGENQVYLDLTHIPAETLDQRNVRWRRSAPSADAHLSRRALFNGRVVG